jgi:hypothetical protein
MKKRIELSIFTKTSIDSFKLIFDEYNFVNVYIKTNLSNISETRKEMIELGYTTRLFVVFNNGKKEEFIFGKLKGQKGVFKEHCKNSVFRNSIENVIPISSNKDDSVLLDDLNIKNNYIGDSREWIII